MRQPLAVIPSITRTIRAISERFQNRKISLNRAFGPIAGRRAGMVVNADNAMTLAAFYRGVRYIADMLMSMPWDVHYQTDPMGSRYPVNGRLAWLLNEQANDELSANIWRSTTVAQMIVLGNSYSEILRDSQNRPIALGHPIERGRTQMYRDSETNEIFYRVYNTPDRNRDEGFVDLPRDRVFHSRGPGDSYQGVSVITYAMHSLGIAMAQESNTGTFFGNGSQASGILSFPGALTKEKRTELSHLVKDMLSGPDAFNVMVLQKGEQWQQLGLSNQDTQALEYRSFSVNEISRWLGLPPHILMDYSRMTWNNLEQASTETVRSGLMPWAIWLEREANAKLVALRNRRRVSTRLNLDGLLRADLKTRTEAYARGRQWGWLSGNDIRRREEMPPIPGLDSYWQPVNMTVAAEAPAPQDAQEMLSQIENADDEVGRFALGMVQIDSRTLNPEESLAAEGCLPFGSVASSATVDHDTEERLTFEMLEKVIEMISGQCWDAVFARETNQFSQTVGRDDFSSWAAEWVRDKHMPWVASYLDERLFAVGKIALDPGLQFGDSIESLLASYHKSAERLIEDLADGANPDKRLDARRLDARHYAAESMKILQVID